MKFAHNLLIMQIFLFPLSVSAAGIGELAENCDACHGPQGVSSESDVPTIAGQLASYVEATLKSYQDWGRPCIKSAYRFGDTSRPKTTMCKIAESLDGEEIEAIAQHYEAQEFVAARQEFDEAQASAGGDLHEIHCETCHAMGGSIAGRGPILAGQWTPYLRTAINQASTGEHLVPPIMEKRLANFSAEEIDALVNFYASQQN